MVSIMFTPIISFLPAASSTFSCFTIAALQEVLQGLAHSALALALALLAVDAAQMVNVLIRL